MDQDRSAVPQAPRCPSPDSPDAGVLVLNWMSLLPVSPGARYVYALIYQYSADGAGCYAGGAVYAALRCGVSERSARRAIKELVDKGLVRRVRPYVQGDSRYCLTLQVALDRVASFRREWSERIGASGKGCYDGPVGVAAEMTGIGNQIQTHDKVSGDRALAPDKVSGGDDTSPDRLSGDHMTLCPVADSGPQDNLSGEGLSPHDTLSGGQNVHRSDCPVVETEEIRGQSAAQDILSGDHMTECPVYPPIYINKDLYPSYPSNPSIPKGDVPVEPDGNSLRMAEANLAASAVNRRGLDRIHGPLEALMSQGIGIEEIQSAWDRRQEDARKTVSGDRYMPNLAKWLAEEGPAGAWAMVAVERGRRRRKVEDSTDRGAGPRLVKLSDGRMDVWGYVTAQGAPAGVLRDEDGMLIRVDADGSLELARRALALKACDQGKVA